MLSPLRVYPLHNTLANPGKKVKGKSRQNKNETGTKNIELKNGVNLVLDLHRILSYHLTLKFHFKSDFWTMNYVDEV